LAGFSNPTRALYSAVRELIENSLDACELAGILPELEVTLETVEPDEPDPRLYVLQVRDNGPGIDPARLPYAFGRVFYGSKFVLRQSRGMFGLGGTMSILYSQITSNRPAIISTADGEREHIYTLLINIQENAPMIISKTVDEAHGRRGLTIRLTMEGDFGRSAAKIHEYLRQTAMVAPYAKLTFIDHTAAKLVFDRATDMMPAVPKETKPHPYGIDVETLRRLIRTEPTPLLDLTLEVLDKRLKKELGFGVNKVSALGQAVVEELRDLKATNRQVTDIRELMRHQSDLSKESQTYLAKILDKWESLSKQSKTLISIFNVSRCSPDEVQQLKTDSLNFVRETVRVRGSDRPLLAVEPFYTHLKRIAGGEPLDKFMCKNFHRVGENLARKFLAYARFDADRLTRTLSDEDFVSFVEALHRFPDFLTPDASCLSPLGEELMRKGIQKELQPEFSAVAIRNPSAYSGYPFIVEVGLAYGGKVIQPGLKLYRFANRIPLLYDEANDISWRILEEVDWKRYRIPDGAPLAVITHVCSTKIPYKTVGKEYLADRPELERELKNGIRDVLRNLAGYLSRKGSIEQVKRKMNILGKYLPLIATFSTDLSGATRPPRYRRLIGQSEEVYEGQGPPVRPLTEQETIIKQAAGGIQTKLEQFSD